MTERYAIGDLVQIQDETGADLAPGVIVGYLVRPPNGETYAAFENDTVSVPTLEDAEQSGILKRRETLVSTAQENFSEVINAGLSEALDELTSSFRTLRGPK